MTEGKFAKPCRIMVAPNGARRGKKDHPNLPITPLEMAETAKACAEAGACAIHLHARDGRGRHTLARHIYDSYLIAVKRAAGDQMTIQITTEAVGRYTPEQQMQAVRDIKPEAISIALREVLPVTENEGSGETKAAEFLAWLERKHIDTQYILFDPEEIGRLERLRQRGIIPDQHRSVLFVLGRYEGKDADPTTLHQFLEAGGMAYEWMLCAFGRHETACLTAAMCLGGDVRVGFENSLVLGNGRIAQDNAEKVREIRAIAERVGRQVKVSP